MDEKIGVVIVCYKNHSEVSEYINCQLSKLNEKMIIIIIDNSCDNNLSAQFLELYSLSFNSKINCFVNENLNLYFKIELSNLGYAKANNIGVAIINKGHNLKYILFTNSDLIITSNNIVSEMLLAMKNNKSIGAINPKIVGIDNKDQTPFQYMSILRLYILKFLFYPFFRKTSPLVKNANEGFYYRLMGSFILVDLKSFLNIGMFDNETFLYGEELILSERFLKSGFKMYYLPKVKVIHNHSQTIGSFHSYINQVKMMSISEFYYFNKYMKCNLLEIKLAKISLFIYINFYYPIILLLKKSYKSIQSN